MMSQNVQTPRRDVSTRGGKIIFTVAALLLAAALACGGGGASDATEVPPDTEAPSIDTEGTAAALQSTADALAQAQTEQAQVPPTAVTLPTAEAVDTQAPPATESGGGTGGGIEPGTYFDDFSEDVGNWETWDGAQVAEGEFFLGPFADCGDLQADTPYGCFSICLWCGVLTDYEASVDVRYVDGISERTYGIVLQFEDVNGNNWVDEEDYYLEYQVSAFTAFYTDNLYLREHVAGDPVGANGFNFVRRWDARPITNDTYGTNRLGVVVTNSGTNFDLYLNDNFVDTVSFDGVSFSEGQIGLSISGRSVQVAFDDFTITLP
jgi:hypothetical protein